MHVALLTSRKYCDKEEGEKKFEEKEEREEEEERVVGIEKEEGHLLI